jgi:hypothetical protein
MTHFVDPRFVRNQTAPNTPTQRRNPKPAQLVALWSNRAQKATQLQTVGVYHAA